MSYTVTITGSTDTDAPVIDSLTAAVAALPGTVDSATFVGADGTSVSLLPAPVDPYAALDKDIAGLGTALQALDPTDPNVQVVLAAFGLVESDTEALDPTAVLPTMGQPAGAAHVAGVSELPQVTNHDGSVASVAL